MNHSVRHAALVGMMGAGKTAVGRALAALVDLPFLDCDSRIAAAAGRSIPEIFQEDGEEGFRRLESEMLSALLAESAPTVIATGGGVVLAERNRSLLRSRAVVCWLAAKLSSLAARVGAGRGRPLLEAGLSAEDPQSPQHPQRIEKRLADLDAERRRFYEEAADLSLSTDGLSPAAAAVALEGLIRSALPAWPNEPAQSEPNQSEPNQSEPNQPKPNQSEPNQPANAQPASPEADPR